MRIIGGEFKGRRFYPPAKNWPTRPTTDFAKEGLFNILINRYDLSEWRVLDLFGGTGNHSYEFISRGCRDVTYVDQHGPAVAFVKKIAGELAIAEYIRIVRSDAFKFMGRHGEAFDYIFAGPPYPLPTLDTIPDRIMAANMLKPGGLLVLEHNPNHDFKSHPHYQEERHYGKTIFAFFGAEPTAVD